MSRRQTFGCLLVLLAALLALGWREACARAERRLRAELEQLERRTGGRQRASFGKLELRPLQLGGSLRDVRFETQGAEGEPLLLEADELRLEHFVPEALGRATDLDATLVGLRSATLDRELARLPGLQGKVQVPCRIEVTLRLHYDPHEPRPLRLAAHVRAAALGAADVRLATRGLAPQQLEAAVRLLARWGRTVADEGLGAQPRSGGSPQGPSAGIHYRREPPYGTAGDEHALDALAGVVLVEAELSFEDEGLAPALLEREAQRLGLTTEQTRDKLRVDLWSRLEPGPTSQAWIRQAGQAAEAFVGEPRRLRVTLDPPAPVELASLPAGAAHGTQALAELLGFSAVANEAR
jgi:hypothetical protein